MESMEDVTSDNGCKLREQELGYIGIFEGGFV
jgi:hypothetical protein